MTEEQKNCPYCHGQKGIALNGDESYDEEAEGIFLIGNEHLRKRLRHLLDAIA